MARKRKPQTARQRAIAKGVREGLTPGQAYYRYRLQTNLKSGKTVREARGHATSEKPTKTQRSKVAKKLGFDLSKSRKHRKYLPKKTSHEEIYVLSHLTHAQQEREFVRVVLPAARRLQRKHPTSFRITYIGPKPYPPHNVVKWSTEWSIVGHNQSQLIERFYSLWNSRDEDDIDDEGELQVGESNVKILAIHLAKFGD